jgi:predicted AlkP superfamily pyrophosphatase or phosphodiesterase
MRFLCIPAVVLALSGATTVAGQAETASGARRVVVVVFDGMRPDFITPQHAPNLYSLATNGVFFRRNHAVYVTTTIVNGAALATGAFPGRNGIIANSAFDPEFDAQTAVATEALNTVRRGDLLTGGKYIAVDTLAEVVQDAGFHTYVAGTKGVALIHDRRLRRTDTAAHSNSITLFRGVTLPRAAFDPLKKVNEDRVFPDTFTHPNIASDSWSTRALTRGLWKHGVPRYSLLWLSDPDVTQHNKGLGTPGALEAIAASDTNLGRLIEALKDKRVYDQTDILVVSDHGFSTIDRSASITAELRDRGIHAHSKLDNPEPGDVVVVGLGGSALMYVVDRVEDVVRKTAAVLQTCDFTGVIFSRLPIEGTFPMDTVGYPVTSDGPDLLLSLRWSPDRNDEGVPGKLIVTGGDRNAGAHGSLSRYDVNNTLVAFGPSFKRGHVSDIPSGNVDLAPTVLHLLGLKPRESMDGRVLFEALREYDEELPVVSERRLETERQIGFMHWRQYLHVHEVSGVRYYTEGNGELSFRRPEIHATGRGLGN